MPSNKAPHLVSTGDRFSRLTVVGFSHNDKRYRRHYKVRCDCGAITTVQGTLLRSGNTKSCGCLSKEIKRSRKLPNDRGVVNHIILQYKRHAKARGIAFYLTVDQVDRLIRDPCYYCGVVGGNLKKTKNCKDGFKHNGMDRVDSSKDYTPDNVVPCCGMCNTAKRDMSRDEFVSMARRIVNHQAAMAEQWPA